MLPLQARCGPEGGYSSMTAALEGDEWSAARPGRTLPPGKTQCPLYRRLGRPQGRSGRAEKSRPRRDSIPDRPARSQSLYQQSYRAHNIIVIYINNNAVINNPSGRLKDLILLFRITITGRGRISPIFIDRWGTLPQKVSPALR